MKREGFKVARCTVECLMGELDLEGVTRGRRFKVTTTSADAAPRPLDLVVRDFAVKRPNALWVSDLTYVATWLVKQASSPPWAAGVTRTTTHWPKPSSASSRRR